MAVPKDGKSVAVGSVYNLIRVWDVATGKERFDPPDGHDAPVHAVAFSPDGRLLATGGENKQIRVWDPATGRVVKEFHDGSAGQLSFSPDGKRLVAAWSNNPKVRILDVNGGAETANLPHDGGVQVPSALYTVDGKKILSVSWQRSNDAPSVLKIWDAETGKPTAAITLAGLLWPCALAESPDGRWAAVGGTGGDRPLHLVDMKRMRERTIVLDEQGSPASLAFSPDGRVLVIGAIDRTVRLIEIDSGTEILRLKGHERTVTAIAVAPDGSTLATGEGGPVTRYWEEKLGPQTIRFWDMKTGKEFARLGGHDSDVGGLAFAPDGRSLVSGLSNGLVLTWKTPEIVREATPAGRVLAKAELTALWKDLGEKDARKAYEAVRAFGESEQGIRFLAESVSAAKKPNAEEVRGWLANLDSAKFPERAAASRNLARIGDDIEIELREALRTTISAEERQRIEKLLDALSNQPPPERLRESRAVWALELNGSQKAQGVLLGLSSGDQAARLTRDAKAALGRLRRD